MPPEVNGCSMIRPALPDPELGRPLHANDNAVADATHSGSDGQQRSGRGGVLSCLRHIFLWPLCCFPLAAGARPLDAYQGDGLSCFWLPPVLGLAPIFWLTLFVTVGVGAAAQYYWEPVLLTAFVLLSYILSVALHEFAHAAIAYAGGDESVVYAGYLTLDYLRYASPIYSYGLPLLFVLFGGIALPGAAVRVQVGSLRNRGWETLTALAGPLTNLILGFVASGVFHLLLISGLQAYTILHIGLACLIYFEAMSVMLSLIPLPPFDGWAAICPWLPERFFLKQMMKHPTQSRIIQLLVLAALLPLFARVHAIGDLVFYVATRVFQSPSAFTAKALYYFYLPYRDWRMSAASPFAAEYLSYKGMPLGVRAA